MDRRARRSLQWRPQDRGKRIFFDPSELSWRIVTCAGSVRPQRCIRSMRLSLYHHYGVKQGLRVSALATRVCAEDRPHTSSN